MIWCTVLNEEIIGPYLFKKENVTVETYKWLLRYCAIPKLRVDPEETISNKMVLLCIYSFLYVSKWFKNTPTFGVRELVPFHGSLATGVDTL